MTTLGSSVQPVGNLTYYILMTYTTTYVNIGCRSQTDESGDTTMSRRSAPFSLPSCHTPGGAPRNHVRVTICHLHPPAASANPIRPSESLNSRPTP